MSGDNVTFSNRGVFYRQYNGESDLQYIMSLVQNELSEPYVIYTYRYFLQGWPKLSFLAFPEAPDGTCPDDAQPIGVIVCKQSIHKGKARRGYIAMLSVDRTYRKRGIASTLVKLSIDMMTRTGADEIVLETEVDNEAALGLYSSLGFIREKRLYRFYMNGKDAFRLVLPVLPLDPTLLPSSSMNAVTTNFADVHAVGSSQPFAISASPSNQPLSSSRTGGSAPMTVPLSVYQAAHINLPLAPMGKMIPLDKPLYPEDESTRSRPRFALGGLLGAASPRSLSADSRDSGILDSPSSSLSSGNSGSGSSPSLPSLARIGSTSSAESDVFTLYGSHIPASISPPIPKRSQPAVSVAGIMAQEEYYISTR